MEHVEAQLRSRLASAMLREGIEHVEALLRSRLCFSNVAGEHGIRQGAWSMEFTGNLVEVYG